MGQKYSKRFQNLSIYTQKIFWSMQKPNSTPSKYIYATLLFLVHSSVKDVNFILKDYTADVLCLG